MGGISGVKATARIRRMAARAGVTLPEKRVLAEPRVSRADAPGVDTR